MAKIVLDAREYTTSTGRYMSKLIEYLQETDKENVYVVLLREKDMDKFTPTNPNFSKVMTPFKEFTFGEQLGFAKQLYGLKADLVHFGMVQQPILYFKKSVSTIHDLTTVRFVNPSKNPVIFFIKQQVYKAVIWYAAHKSKVIFTGSNFVKEDLIKYSKIKPAKIVVTYEAADYIKEGSKPIKSLAGKQFLMYVGRPMPHKNLWRLIEAFDSLKGVHPELQLVLAGQTDKNYSDIERRVSSNGIDDVHFTGYISEGELKWLYENCQAYIFPSLSEGFGLPGLEAMAHGAPVVSSNATCLPEIYGDAAHYFDPKDKQSIASAINDVLVDKGLRDRLVKAGREQVKKYSWKRMAEQTLEQYNKTAG